MATKKSGKKVKNLKTKALSGKHATGVRGGTIEGVAGESIDSKHPSTIDLWDSPTRKK
jgi:hypothetical protein